MATLTLGFSGLLGGEILLARRAERIEPFTADDLNGDIGDGKGEPLRMAWIGDSTGDGVGASAPDFALPRVVARGLDRPVDLTVLARSGSTVADALAEQLPRLADLKPDWVFIALGGNDVIHLTSRSTFRTRMNALLDGVKAVDPEKIIVLGLGEFGSTVLFKQPLRAIVGLRGHQIDGDVANVAADHGVIHVDIIGRAAAQFFEDPVRYHARDRFHPSDEGYGLWAKATLDTLQEHGLL